MKARSLSLLLISFLCHVASAKDEGVPAAEPLPSEAASISDRELARRLFSAAVSLARAGRNEAAKSLFLEAYAVAPHYLVWYNIAQADLRLGDLSAAVRDLRRFLEEGGAQVPAEQRSAVEGEIAELEKDLARASNAPGGPVEADPSPSAPEPPLSSALPPVSAAVPIDPWAAAAVNSALTPVRPPVSTQLGAAAARETTPPAWTYAVITGGFMLLGGAGGLYAWNDDRYQHWRTEDSALSDLKQQDIAQGIAPREDTVIRDRARRNDTLIRSVQRFDAVPFVVAGAGLAAMGIGLWGLLDRRNDAALQFSVGTSSVELDAQLFW